MKHVNVKDLRFPRRRRAAHKGENGRVLVIAGSPEYPGAAALAGLAALRSGADIVRVAAPEKVAWAINCLTPDLITIKMPGMGRKDVRKLLMLSRQHDSVLIGNGLGACPWAKGFVKKCETPIVIDADALKEIAITDARDAILTPHAKEFEALCRNSDSTDETLQERLDTNVVILKGEEDIIMTKNGSWKNTTGNCRMAVGGTGDVLAGMCAGFRAQGLGAWHAAILAAYINGRAGDSLLARKGYSFLASDLAEDAKGMIMKTRRSREKIRR